MLRYAFFLCAVFSSVSLFAQFEFGTKTETETERSGGPLLGTPIEQTWRAGIVIEPGAQMDNVVVTIPLPRDWYEQKVVRINEEKMDAALSSKIEYRDVLGGAKEMVLKLGRMRPHRKVEIVVAVDLQNYDLLPPTDTENYVVPKRFPRGLDTYIRKSPTIECDKRQFLNMFNEITKEQTTDWDKVEAIYSFVQNNVKYNDEGRNKPAKGAWAVINMPKGQWEGDCKDMCCLFVAICRAGRIPARIVRVPEHCYAEFYLEQKSTVQKPAKGFWFPCQVAGTYSFGGIPERQVILQKGDSFPDPDAAPRGRKLFLTECFEGNLVSGSPPPKFRWIHEVEVR